MFYSFWPDRYYIILVVPALLISIICQIAVKSTFKKMSRVQNRRQLSGAEAAERLLMFHHVRGVSIVPIDGQLSDHFDPRTNTIRLSKSVYFGRTIAAVGVACHEAGHACQYAESYKPLKIREKILPIANIGSSCGMLLAFLGLFLGMGILTNIGILLFMFVVLFELATLPVEVNASKRALQTISQMDFLDSNEFKGAKKVLIVAAMTYVASILTSLASLLRLILIASRRNNR